MSTVIGVALFGAGRMAKVHAPSITAAGGKIVTVYDPVTQAAEAIANETGATVASSVEAAMSNPDVGAVVIATSSDTHVALIQKAVEAGKPVLCEKPVASTFADARGCLAQIGEKAARKVFIGFNRRFDCGHATLREAVLAGEIGHIEQLIITSRDPEPPPIEYVSRSGGLFRDMMIHDFDLARGIVGKEFVSVTAHGSSIIDPAIGRFGDVDSASVTLVTEDGTIVTILNSRRCSFGYDQRVEAFGSEGMVISDNPRQSGCVRYSATAPGCKAPLSQFFMDRYGPSYTEEIRLFLECARKGTDMPVNMLDGIKAAWLAEAASASLKQGKTVHLTGLDQEFGDA